MNLLGWIPLVGSVIVVGLMGFMSLLYPVLAIYGLSISSLGEQQIKCTDKGIRIVSKRSQKEVAWIDIEKLYDVFNPPGFSYNLELKNGNVIKLNPFAEVSTLKNELEKRNIQIDIRQNPSRST